MSEPDVFFYFALVENYLRTGHWPTQDPFSYALANDYLMSLHQWLGYWIFYWPYQLAGWVGPIVLKAALVAVIFMVPLLPFWFKRRAIPGYFPALWTLAIFIAHHRFRERVSLFGDLFSLLLIGGLFWCAEMFWFWCGLPFLFLAWAQLHPSFPLGWALLGAHFLTRKPRTWQRYQIISAVVCLLVPLVNPLGLTGTLYPFSFALNIEPYLRQYVVEWLPLTDSRLFPFRFLYIPFITLVPWIGWWLWRERSRIQPFAVVVFILAVALSVKSVRFGLLAQGIFLVLLCDLAVKREVVFSRMKWLVTAVLCVIIVGVKTKLSTANFLPLNQRFKIDTGYFPEAATDALILMRPQLRIYHSFGFGGYLAWRWQGDPPIFFHGFSTNFKLYEEIYNRPQENQEALDRVIERYDIGVFFLSRMGNDNNFIELLERHPGWQKIREDHAAVIYAKRDARVFP